MNDDIFQKLLDEDLFLKLVDGIRVIYPSSLKDVILFGSVARGTATEESDIDIAVLLDSDSDYQHDSLLYLVTDLNLEYDVVISIITIDNNKFNEWCNVLPFYRNVKNEGVVLWKAA